MSLRYGILSATFLVASALPALAQEATNSAVCPETVTLESGDTLGSIAGRCGTTVAAIREANPQLGDPRRLQIGTEISVPAPVAAPGATAGGETEGAAGVGDAAGYVIRQGDTWDSIAASTGVGVEALMQANPEIASVALNAGARIAVPSREEAKGPPPELPKVGGGTALDTGTGSATPEGSTGGGEADPGLRVAGRLTDEGVECPALRSLDGALYTLAGDIDQFGPGDEVVVTGTKAETSFCMQGTTINVEKIAPAS